MSQWRTKIFGASALVAVIALVAIVNCTPSDRSTESYEDEVSQNAAEAEQAEAKIAEVSGSSKTEQALTKKPAKDAKPAKVARAAAKGEKEAGKSRKPATAGKESLWVVEVGAFKVKENAEKLYSKLKTAGYPVQVQTKEHSKNGMFHFVRVEPTMNKAEAVTMLDTLKSKEKMTDSYISVLKAQ